MCEGGLGSPGAAAQIPVGYKPHRQATGFNKDFHVDED
jgi:hypothetical protein